MVMKLNNMRIVYAHKKSFPKEKANSFALPSGQSKKMTDRDGARGKILL